MVHAPQARQRRLHPHSGRADDNRDNDWHTGVLYSMTKALARPYKPAREWNTKDIAMQGLRTIVKVNGVLVTPVPPKEKSYEPDRRPRPETLWGRLPTCARLLIALRQASYHRSEFLETIQKKTGATRHSLILACGFWLLDSSP
ncbi:MAG TPA: family 16 glycoside hydrolase [Bryobacteraceae bacterium]|nr:family 16 glycoside hydrolase [Bryobacteraceae bacterium]